MSIIISQSNASGTSRVRPVIEAARSMCPTKGAAVNARSQVTARPAGEALFDPRRRRTQMRFPAAARPRVRRVRTVPVQDLRDPLRQRHLGAIPPDTLTRVVNASDTPSSWNP